MDHIQEKYTYIGTYTCENTGSISLKSNEEQILLLYFKLDGIDLAFKLNHGHKGKSKASLGYSEKLS